jgi:hypothetical protein
MQTAVNLEKVAKKEEQFPIRPVCTKKLVNVEKGELTFSLFLIKFVIKIQICLAVFFVSRNLYKNQFRQTAIIPY